MGNDDNDDPKPVSFKELRNRWAQHESGGSGVGQQEPTATTPSSGIVDATGTITATATPPPSASTAPPVATVKPIAPSSTAASDKELPTKATVVATPASGSASSEPVNITKAPPIPPKPSSVTPTIRTPPAPAKSPPTLAPSESSSTNTTSGTSDQRQKVSLLAQQFEKQKVTQAVAGAGTPQPPPATAHHTSTSTTPNVTTSTVSNTAVSPTAPIAAAAAPVATPALSSTPAASPPSHPPFSTPKVATPSSSSVTSTHTNNNSNYNTQPARPAATSTQEQNRDISEQQETAATNAAQDPFCDEEEVSGWSDSDDSSSETNNTSSDDNNDSEMDDRLVRQVHMRYADGASSSGSFDSATTTTTTTLTRTPPPPPKDALKKTGIPPPPPPPSKKYHSAARRPGTSTVAVDIPEHDPHEQQQQQSTTGKSFETSPPSLPPRPSLTGRNTGVGNSVAGAEGGMPVLPPRPSTSTLARSHTIGTSMHHNHHHHQQHVPLPDYQPDHLPQSMGAIGVSDYDRPPRRSQSTRTPSARRAMSRSQMQMANEVYPDATNASRKKPIIESKDHMTPSVIPTGHKSTKNAVAISGAVLATGAHETRIWDTKLAQCLHTIDGNGSTSGSGGSGGGSESNDKVCALEFAPTLEPRQEGQYLWVGSKDGELVVIDTMSGKVIARPHSTHTQAIIWILRYKNTEMWTIDEGGVLNVWEVLDGIRLVEEHVVTPRAAAALIVGRELWMATTRAFEVHRFGVHNLQQQQQQQPGPRVRIPNELGDIVQLTTVPYHVGKIFIGHGNGKVSVWDAKTMERLEVITVSMYAISCMVSLGEYHLWMGFNTGMIYVYDTRPERWLVVKLWKAHESGVTNFVVDKIGLALDEPTVQVVSLDSHGYASFWDGLLSEHWKGQQMEKFRADYSVEQDTRILICSWNIDANKPEKLPYNDDQLVRAWLSGMRDPDPDIIVVGIQEIVDLESKKQTARSLFASRKKIETLQEADELLTHRYTLWHDYLARVIADNYGRGAYTVIKTDQLVGLFSCIFVRSSELRRVSAVESTVVKTGMKVMKKSLHGNKGGIAIRLQMDDSSLCFVNCHLAAGQSHQAQRNTDAEGILKEAVFPARPQDVDAYPRGGDGTLILDHEHCFLSGDLNYRINMHREKVLQHLASRNAVEGLAALQKEDQLLKQRYTNPFFKLLVFQESPIHFLPTYKYDPGTDYYDRSEKKRVPAWCDRILYRSNGVQNLFYQRHEVLASDHRPISGGFIVRVKRVDQSQKARVAHNVEQAWQQHYQQLVNEHKAMYVGDFNIQDAVHQLQAVNWDVHQIRY